MKQPDSSPDQNNGSKAPDLTFCPDAIYFDTNPLIAAGWPTASAQLSQTIQLAEGLGIKMCLPETVQQELEGHRTREVYEKWNGINSEIEKLNKKTQPFLGFEKLPLLPPADELRTEFKKLAADLTQRFTPVSVTQRGLGEFVDLAINRGATFEQGGRGFQDAVILCSILDHLKATGVTNAILVTEDAAFRNNGCKKMNSAAGVNLKVNTLDEVEELLQKSLTSRNLEYLEHEKAMWRAALETQLARLQTFLSDNLEIDVSKLEVHGLIERLLSLTIVSIEKVHAPLDALDAGTLERFKVSADVKCVLSLDVENPFSPEIEKIKVGYSANLPVPSLRGWFPRSDKINQEVLVTVEAMASKKDNAYTDVEFIGARITGNKFFSQLGALGGSQ